MLQAIAGYDPADPTSADVAVPDYCVCLQDEIEGLRIGWIRHFYEDRLSADDEMRLALKRAVTELSGLGTVIEEVKLRGLQDYDDCKLIISEAEFSAVHERYLQERSEDFGANLRFRGVPGALIRAVDYIQAQRQRCKMVSEMEAVFEDYDGLVTLCTYGPVPKIGDNHSTHFFQRPNLTAAFYIRANSALSICTGYKKGRLPLPMQIIGKPFDEVMILRIAHAYERTTPWRQVRPVLP